jgi:hypothetical protein
MNIIQHAQDYIILKNKISVFNQLIGLSKISRKLNYHRRSKLSLLSILSWFMVSIFQQRSLYRAEKTKQFTTRTVRNVLNDARINWQRLTCLLAGGIIDYLRRIKTLDGRRKLAFVLDDTLIKRSFSKKTELLAKTYDHDRGKYLKGYRGLTLAITDGNTLLPVNYALMSSENQRNRIGSPARFTDLRTLAGHRWQIEGFFKVAKQYLRLDRSQIQSYDGFCAHFALVMMAYDILAWQQRESVDYHSMGDLFFELNRDLTDITLIEALTQLLVNLVSYVSGKIFIEKKINEFLNEFFDQLPGSFSKLLTV